MSFGTRDFTKRSATVAVAALLVSLTQPAHAAQDLLAIQISGVPGDTAFATANVLPPSSIEVLSASLGLSTPVNISLGGVKTSVPNFQDLAIFKNFNNSSPALAMDEMIGKLIPTAILSFYTGTPGSFKKYYTITLTNVYVSSIGLSDSQGSGGATEAVSFAYAQIRFVDNLSGVAECYNRLTQLTC
ncbi:MAG TPA: type VI secretion system tube protein Hcp [Steroidobacteraceae bacterium]|nr:type VI secretion system tube protein Hcp [Steroidobacteraceae bacterium]